MLEIHESKSKIEEQRDELEYMIEQDNIINFKIIAVSKKLDNLINDYYSLIEPK